MIIINSVFSEIFHFLITRLCTIINSSFFSFILYLIRAFTQKFSGKKNNTCSLSKKCENNNLQNLSYVCQKYKHWQLISFRLYGFYFTQVSIFWSIFFFELDSSHIFVKQKYIQKNCDVYQLNFSKQTKLSIVTSPPTFQSSEIIFFFLKYLYFKVLLYRPYKYV